MVMISISNGTIIRLKSRENKRSRPGNFSREKANAARIVVNCVQATQASVTITELQKYVRNGAFSNA